MDMTPAFTGLAGGAASGGMVGGLPGALIGGAVGGLSGMFGSSAADRQRRAREQAITNYNNALNTYATQQQELGSYLGQQGMASDEASRASLANYLNSSPDMAAMLAALVGSRAQASQAAGAPAWQTPGGASGAERQFMRGVQQDRQGRASAALAPGAFAGAATEAQQAEHARGLGQAQEQADLQRQLAVLRNTGALQSAANYEPLSAAQRAYMNAMGQAQTAGSNQALVSGLLSSLGQLGALGYMGWATRPQQQLPAAGGTMLPQAAQPRGTVSTMSPML